MDDVTNTLDAAATAAQPSVRVRVVDATTRKTMNDLAEVVFVPQQPLVVDSFKNCEGLSRIAFLDGNTAVMLGKVTNVVSKADMPAEETGKKKK